MGNVRWKLRSDGVFAGFFRNKTGIVRVVLVLAVGALFLWLGLRGGGNDGTDTRDELTQYKESLESELSELCSDIRGVGKCRVFVSFSVGSRTEYRGSSVVSVAPPEVQAVNIVCEGADDDVVRYTLVNMISSTFGIGTNRITVAKMS